MTVSAATILKANRLLTAHRVFPRDDGETFDVKGDTGWHVVWIPQRNTSLQGSCTRCKAFDHGHQCSHIVAVKTLIETETP